MLKDMQKPRPEAKDLNERMSLVEEAINKLVKETSVSDMGERMNRVEEAISSVKTKLTDIKEDLSDNRQYSTSKYHELRMETNDNLEAANSKYHELRQSHDDLKNTLGKHDEKTGTTYFRWGRKTCPAGTDSVYTGYAGGSYFNHKGAAVSMLCLPVDPEWHEHSDSSTSWSGYVYGAEYEPSTRLNQFFGDDLGQHDVPCAVCNNKQRSSSIMIPGKTTCHTGWNIEYSGYLMSGYHGYDAATDYYCVDKGAESLPGGAKNENGKLLFFVEAQCGSLKCPPYENGWELACVVCSK